MKNSRWCEVLADPFNFVISPTRMISAQKGDVLYLPEYILECGVAAGELKRVPRPAGFTVDKSGRVCRVH